MIPDMDQMLTTSDVANLLGVDQSTIRRDVRLGRLTPTQRVANGWMLFDAEEVVRYRAVRALVMSW